MNNGTPHEHRAVIAARLGFYPEGGCDPHYGTTAVPVPCPLLWLCQGMPTTEQLPCELSDEEAGIAFPEEAAA